jgi:hypothetical protein
MSESKSSSGGVGFTGLLTIAFIVLKLSKVIDWPWWWVISPIWISIVVVLLVFGGMGAYYFIQSYREKIYFEKRNKQRQAEITDLQNRYNELSEQIGMSAPPESKWQQRMNEMNKQKSMHWSNKSS